MVKNALIIFGSPNKNGDVGTLVKKFIDNFDGKITIINCFSHLSDKGKGISPCVNCKYCSKKIGCCVQDDFQKIIEDSYDIVVLAAPIYDYILPGPVMNIVSRFNSFWHNKRDLHIKPERTKKTAVLIITAGGTGVKAPCGLSNESLPVFYANWIFKGLNATLYKKNTVMALNCDFLPIEKNKKAINSIIKIAKSFN